MHPALVLNYGAMAIAVVTSFTFGFIWYGPFLGKKWAELTCIEIEKEGHSKSEMRKGLIATLIGTIFTVYIMSLADHVWRASFWGAGVDGPFYIYGFFGGFYPWLGFYIPQLLAVVTWEGKPWKLLVVNGTYHFINLQIIGMILAYWR